MAKFAVVHPTLTAAESAETHPQAQSILDALQLSTLIPGFIRIVPDPLPPSEAADALRRQTRTRGRRSLLRRAYR